MGENSLFLLCLGQLASGELEAMARLQLLLLA